MDSFVCGLSFQAQIGCKAMRRTTTILESIPHFDTPYIFQDTLLNFHLLKNTLY